MITYTLFTGHSHRLGIDTDLSIFLYWWMKYAFLKIQESITWSFYCILILTQWTEDDCGKNCIHLLFSCFPSSKVLDIAVTEGAYWCCRELFHVDQDLIVNMVMPVLSITALAKIWLLLGIIVSYPYKNFLSPTINIDVYLLAFCCYIYHSDISIDQHLVLQRSWTYLVPTVIFLTTQGLPLTGMSKNHI